MSIVTQKVNHVLESNQLAEVISNLLINKPVKILRIIQRTGRNQIAWVHIENEITGDRMATFIPFADLLRSFWCWLETAELMLRALWERILVGKVIWQYLVPGEQVYSPEYGWVKLATKDIKDNNIPRFWLRVPEGLIPVPAWEVEIF